MEWRSVRRPVTRAHGPPNRERRTPPLRETLATLDEATALSEMRGSKSILEEKLQESVRWFAYPFGGKSDFPLELLPVVEEAGYEGCVSGYGGFIHAGEDRRMLPREPVPSFRSNLFTRL